MGEVILFLGLFSLQVFWAVPVIKRGGKIWQIIGIGGTCVLLGLWLSDRLHLLPEGGGGPSGHMPPREPRGNFTGGEFPKGPASRGLGLEIGGILVPPIEMFQIAFVGLYVVLSKMISSRQNK